MKEFRNKYKQGVLGGIFPHPTTGYYLQEWNLIGDRYYFVYSNEDGDKKYDNYLETTVLDKLGEYIVQYGSSVGCTHLAVDIKIDERSEPVMAYHNINMHFKLQYNYSISFIRNQVNTTFQYTNSFQVLFETAQYIFRLKLMKEV